MFFKVDEFWLIIRSDFFQPLDRDPPSGRFQWQLTVTASDGEHEATTTVVVNVKDINDNRPFFGEPTIEAAVPENSPNGEHK